MANFYPKESKNIKNYAERKVFDKLKKDASDLDWTIMHSLSFENTRKLRERNETRKNSLEGDFVIIIPFYGVCVVEVKGGRVSYNPEKNQWIYQDLSSRSETITKRESPWDQARQIQYALRDITKENNILKNQNSEIKTMVVFTGTDSKDIPVFPEVDKDILFDRKMMNKKKITDFILDLFDSKRQEFFNEKKSIELKDILRPQICNFSAELFKYHKENTSKLDELIKKQSNSLQVIYKALGRKNLFINGPAGTGKTLLAQMIAQERLLAGDKILFLCKTKNLIDVFRSRISVDFSNNITIVNIDSISNITKKEYNFLIVDEAQDVITEKYLENLNSFVKGGLSKLKSIYLGDFDYQTIFKENVSEDSSIDLLKSYYDIDFEKHRLTTNCRNNRDVVNLLQKWKFYENEILLFDEVNSIFRSKYSFVDFNSLNWIQPLREIIEEDMLNYEITANKVVLLSTSNQTKEHLINYKNLIKNVSFKDLKENTVEFENNRISKENNNIVYCDTVHSFKGLESEYVILCIDYIDSSQEFEPYLKKLIYVGSTRANLGLRILFNKKYKKNMLDIL